MHVLATAGHVDHGKSTLIRALTGIDPDRLEEEKRRGLTIDLGFAWLPLPSGNEVGIVDVPGHERFIKNMLAGVGSTNAALLVVAANEGWMPQSQEHAEILHLLGVTDCLLVITKSDTVSKDELEAVTASVRGHLQDTRLQHATTVAVSAATGEGLEVLRQQIDAMLTAVPHPQDISRPRLWIDRSFSIKGSGTVVTGTLVGGSLAIDDDVQLYPSGKVGRVRSLQSHRKQFERLGPGNRVAVNVAGLTVADIARGDVLARPGDWEVTKTALASAEFIGDFEPTQKGAFKFYTGSLEANVRIDVLSQGEPSYVVLYLDPAAPLAFHDRFVLRETGRRKTVGGGLILETDVDQGGGRGRIPRARLLATAQRRSAVSSIDDYLDVIVAEKGYLSFGEIERKIGGRASSSIGVTVSRGLISKEYLAKIKESVDTLLAQYHLAHPLDPGMPISDLRSASSLEAEVFDAAVEHLRSEGSLAGEQGAVRLPSFRPQQDSPEETRLLEALDSVGAAPPSIGELRTAYGADLIKSMLRSGSLVQISTDLAFSARWLGSLKGSIRELVENESSFTVARFRDAVGTTRKYAVPLLEFLDRSGFTMRDGDVRTLGPRADA